MTALWQRANGGDPEAMVELARRYFRGIDLPLDRAEGAKWLLKAADAGHRLAEFNAGVLYERGLSVPERNFHIEANATTAAYWYGKAAEAGVPLAQHNLAMLYRYGSGVQRDSVRAYGLLREAAKQGLSMSMLTLGDMHKAGEGTARDAVMALAWYRLALLVEQRQSQGQATALQSTLAERIASVQDQLNPDERAKAEQFAATEMQALMGTPRPATAPAEVPVDRAAQISEIQRLLTKLGYYKGEADGKLGANTRAAIRNFERKTGLGVSGEVSPALADALRNALTAQAVPAPTPPPAPSFGTAPPGPAASPAPAGWPGERRAQVAMIQKLLLDTRFYTGETDGKIGPATRTAIRNFEKQSGMQQTGESTPELYVALQRYLEANKTPAAVGSTATPDADKPAAVSPPAQPAPDGWPPDRRGQVRAIQKLLADLQLYLGDLDGKMGPGTRNSIRGFEKQAGLAETGEATSDLYVALQKYASERKPLPAGGSATPAAAKPQSQPGPADYPTDRALQIGRTQLLLQQLGYYDGGIDGQLGKGTRAALSNFQREAGLPETGEPSPETWAALQKRQADKAPKRQ